MWHSSPAIGAPTRGLSKNTLYATPNYCKTSYVYGQRLQTLEISRKNPSPFLRYRSLISQQIFSCILCLPHAAMKTAVQNIRSWWEWSQEISCSKSLNPRHHRSRRTTAIGGIALGAIPFIIHTSVVSTCMVAVAYLTCDWLSWDSWAESCSPTYPMWYQVLRY